MSVVMPTFNRLDRLKMALAALEDQTVDAGTYEVIVVSDGSTDGTDEYLRGADPRSQLKVWVQANSGPSVARNAGVTLACGPTLLFVDDDVVAERDLIEQHLRTHRREGRGAVVIGPMLTPAGHRPDMFVRWEQAMLYKQYAAMKRGDYAPTFRQFYTGNASVERDLLMRAGGFDHRFRRGEDMELAYRLHLMGARFVYNDMAVGNHYAERSAESWTKIARDYGRNEVIFARDLDQTSRLEDLAREYGGRHAAIRRLARMCVGRPRSERALRGLSIRMAEMLDRAALERPMLSTLSGLYNVMYYSGLAEELGGRGALWRLLSTASLANLD